LAGQKNGPPLRRKPRDVGGLFGAAGGMLSHAALRKQQGK
jgi:hypothetical protein